MLKNRTKWSKYDDKVKNLYLSTSMSIPEVANYFGIPYDTLKKRLRSMGVKGHRSKTLTGRIFSESHKKKISVNRIKLGIARGAKNPNWKGGVQGKRSKIMNNPEYAIWRKKVFERDNFVCQGCGWAKGKTLQAHHILPVKSFPEKAFEVKNGITLCKVCHRKVHSVSKIKGEELLGTLRPLRAMTISSRARVGTFEKVHRLIAESRTDDNADTSIPYSQVVANKDIVGTCRKLQDVRFN
ncbi:MAG: HNH endonuclease [Deltaproteobacteria bacterium]|nr:HNH endonuclease [Deltaproteobacteria bacterium]